MNTNTQANGDRSTAAPASNSHTDPKQISGVVSAPVAQTVNSRRFIPPPIEMLSLDDVLNYQHPGLVARIMEEQEIGEAPARQQFKDMLIFLYICGVHRASRPFFPPPLIDEAWHTFLLFTKDYDVFCRSHFGFFVHHSPITPEIREEHELARVNKRKSIEIARTLIGDLSCNWDLPNDRMADCPQSCCPSYDCGD